MGAAVGSVGVVGVRYCHLKPKSCSSLGINADLLVIDDGSLGYCRGGTNELRRCGGRSRRREANGMTRTSLPPVTCTAELMQYLGRICKTYYQNGLVD